MPCSYFLFLEFFNVRYVGVIRFAHHVIRLLLIIPTQQKRMLQQQIYDGTSAKTGSEIGPPLNQFWLPKVHVY